MGYWLHHGRNGLVCTLTFLIFIKNKLVRTIKANNMDIGGLPTRELYPIAITMTGHNELIVVAR